MTLGNCVLTGFPNTVPGASSQNIVLEPPPLAPPGGQQLDPLGRSRVDDGTDSKRHTTSEDESTSEIRQGKV